MYVSRLGLYVRPGHTEAVERKLHELRSMVEAAGGSDCRILHAHFASDESPDVIFEQTAEDISGLEREIQQIATSDAFQAWSAEMSPLLRRVPKRSVYRVV